MYRPNESGWSSSDPTAIDVQGTEGNASDSGYTSNMVTLTTEQYQNLVDNGLVNESTYYFTYEGEEETTEWHFGDKFPIILSGETTNWTFGGTFPVTLTGEGLGTLPITLK